MTSRSEADLLKRLKTFVLIATVFSMLFGVSGLAGWALNLPALVTWGDGTAMAPNAAACFLLAGLSLFLQREQDKRPFSQVRKLTAQVSAALAGLAGLLTLVEQMSGRHLGIDRLLLLRSPGPPIAADRIVMSSVAAGGFLLLSLALLVIDWRTRGGKWPAQFICVAAALAPLLGVLGWIVGPGAPPITLAWPAVVAFALLTAALLCSRAPWAMGGVLTRQRPGARMLRGAFPAVLLVLCALGWLLSKPLLSGAHFTWAEVTVLAIVSGGMIAGFIGWTTFIVDRSDRERERLEDALQLRHDQLDRLLNVVDEPETEARLRMLVKAGVAGAVLLTGLLGALSWRMAQQAAQDADWVAQAHEVSATLELTLRHLVDVETGARGFAMTGHEAFLEPYSSGQNAVSLDLEALRRLVVEPDQVTRLELLAKRTDIRLEEAADLVATRRRSGQTPSLTRLLRGKQAMDAVRSTVQEMEDREKLLLEQRTQRARSTRRFTSSAIGLGSILGIIFLSIAGITVSREIRVAANAQGQVKALNADLERRVEQRTAALEAEAAARLESEGRLAAVIKSATDSIIMVDDQQHITLFNQAAEKMFHCPRNTALGQVITGFIPNLGRFGENHAANGAKGLHDGLWAVRANGEKFQIEASISENELAGQQMFTVILRDVSERKQAEQMRGRLADIVDSSEDAIISKTLEGTISAWNHGAENIFGYPASEALGKTILMLVPPDRAGEEADILAHILAGDSIKHFETVRVRKDGTNIDVSLTISPIRDGDGLIVGASKFARDITGRKQAEDALRHSRQALETKTFMLQSVLDSMVEGLVAADEQGKFILWNPAAEKILGLGAANLAPGEWGAHYELFLPDTITPISPGDSPLERTLRGEAVNTEIFLRDAGPDGGLWLETNGSPLIDKDGVMRGGVVAFRDISRRKADELEIRKLNEDLEERIAKRTGQLAAANQELEAFSYSVSHDLRAPLRHIAGFSKILINEFAPGMPLEAREHLERIQTAVVRMGLLVAGLLGLAKLGRQSLKLCRTDLNEVVDQVISILEPECEGRQVEWRIARLPVLDCDPILMAQVFQNLLGNALKYSRGRASTVIEVDSIQQPDKPAIIFVRDNGAGFNMRYAERLFGVFQRFHTDSEFEGTGVGLATVQRIIQKHGGMIWAEAEVDHGATFYFALQMTEHIGTTAKPTALARPAP
jgi:PAS domain S-box-containing protein